MQPKMSLHSPAFGLAFGAVVRLTRKCASRIGWERRIAAPPVRPLPQCCGERFVQSCAVFLFGQLCPLLLLYSTKNSALARSFQETAPWIGQGMRLILLEEPT